MKLILICDKENNIKKKLLIFTWCWMLIGFINRISSKKSAFSFTSLDFNFVKSIGSSVKSFYSTKTSEESKPEVSQNSEEKINNKEDLMKVINIQDFISGIWDINEKTKNIKVKFEK